MLSIPIFVATLCVLFGLSKGLTKSYPFQSCRGVTDQARIQNIDIVPDVLYCGDWANITITANPSTSMGLGSYIGLFFCDHLTLF